MRKLLDYSLIFFNTWLLIFICFESKIILPDWLVIGGKLHPLVLHLPIGLWAGAIILFLLRKHINDFKFLSQVFFQVIALSAAITACVGMLLAIGGDYDSEQLSRHKYSGAGLSFLFWIAVILFKKVYKAPWMYGLISALVILVGHWGGEITHGENYFSFVSEEPQGENVYQVLVKPIIKEKCSSCHNSSKTKGKLNLDSVELMLKGGENGTALVKGNALESHLMKLIWLPLDDKMHMPPKQKKQLTDEEIEILTEWINAGASEDLTFDALKNDSPLRKYYKEQKSYSFPVADNSVLQEINTPFLTVSSIAVNSPALRAAFYVSQKFNAESLNSLHEVKEQLVELNLNKMPVKDSDLKILSELKNLEILHLNGTDVDGTFIANLKDLTKLKTLSLANTQLKHKDLSGLSKLRTLYIWESGFTKEEIEQLKKLNPTIVINEGSKPNADEIIAINPPETTLPKAFVDAGSSVTLKHALPNTLIKYTLDGSQPDSSNGLVYEKPLQITDRTKIKARAFKQGWLGSTTAEFDYLVNGIKLDSVILQTQPNAQYAAKGARSLYDKRKGDTDNFLDKSWLGYREKPMEAIFQFKGGKRIKSVTLSMMEKLDSYIFPPKNVEIWGKTASNTEVLLAKLSPEQPKAFRARKSIFFDLKIPDNAYTEIRIRVNNVNPLPQWHPGKGTPAWAFIDEVIFN